ncbi:MAG: ABC transporter ATP-binding protein [Anaerolineales bacterium]|nr:ABC transporter ATP-binding protein [Anaerolineales bacterium]MCS7247841.1 ABC transporter ATP-binding protein [Anaerolineales bacterium]MDW8161651.1 ABC transporter ATP-binding protein [Anaerolineales bacterium]MDW8447486.1 ABC transporter ATP-binding protein [Anaerolineales bacterium]
MIETEDLSKAFNGFWAVIGITLRVEAGQVLAMLGPNGAGKTTTVRMLTTVLRPTRGTARVAGYDVLTHPEEVRSVVGVLTEGHGLYPNMSAEEYLDFFARAYRIPAPERKRRIEELLEFFGLVEARRRRVGRFSKGMRQKLALARALLHKPPVLLLDEPTSAMDPASARLVRDAILELRSNERAIIVCTHNLTEAEEIADQIAIINQGRIILCGSPQELKTAFREKARFRIRFAAALNGRGLSLVEGAELLESGEDWLIYQTSRPEKVNPLLIQFLSQQGWPIVSVEEQICSLEEVYLWAVEGGIKHGH